MAFSISCKWKKPDQVNKRIAILGKARKHYLQDLNTVNQRLKKKSEKLRQTDTTTLSRARVRSLHEAVSLECRARDEIEDYISEIDSWLDELRKSND